ncbi:MAG: hypothetical protein JSV34_02385 [Candidatus Omnitrophota bacterium]|nr:MAG: hypothetical protein JSV34_02385 [Candidatus Omnitrophota bacterium]
MKIGIKISVIVCLAVLTGCVGLRDYTFRKNGAVGLRLKQEIGEGLKEGKDYYVDRDGVYFVIHDTKDEILKKFGLPDKREKTVEGYDCWVYNSRKLKLFFKEDYLEDWQEI